MKMLGRFQTWAKDCKRATVTRWRKNVEKREVAKEIAEEKTCRHGIPVTDRDAYNCAYYENPDHLTPAGWQRPFVHPKDVCPVCGAWFCDLDCTEDPAYD